MSRRTVRAVRHEDGHLELLDPVKLPPGTKVSVTLDVAEEAPPRKRPTLPVRKLGPLRESLSRDEIYGDPV